MAETGFGMSLFSSPFSQQTQLQQQTSLFSQQQSSSAFGLSTPFGAASQPVQSSAFGQALTTPSLPFGNAQLTTQMAPVAPLPSSLGDRDIQAIVDAYKEDPGNPNYAFKHLLLSVTEPGQIRHHQYKWAEAMETLEGMDSSNRGRFLPLLVPCLKDLSQRLKLEDEVIPSDAEGLRMTQSNMQMLQRHFQADTLPRIQRVSQKEQHLQWRLLRIRSMTEALEGKGCRIPLVKGEVELAEKLAAITQQLKGSGAELSRRVQSLLTKARGQENAVGGGGGSICLPGSIKIHEQSLADMQKVLQEQTEAIAWLGNVLKRDIRDMKIIMSED